MTNTITINGKDIELHENPKHRAVQQVQDIMTTWIMEKIDMSKIDPNMSLEDAMKLALMSDPELTAEITPMQRTLPFDQTIMLATGMTYKELQKFADDITESEYKELYEAAKDAIGGSAENFFRYYTSGISGTKVTLEMPKPTVTLHNELSESETSTNQL